ncbi:MAG TPA: hypothetical protein VJV78_28075, partial [Polyangiales bacterium]|nr:hypothetical protein [Polyangiales bacterium]
MPRTHTLFPGLFVSFLVCACGNDSPGMQQNPSTAGTPAAGSSGAPAAAGGSAAGSTSSGGAGTVATAAG